MRLLHQDPPILMNVKKIRRLMRKYHLICPIRKPNPYKSIARKRMEETSKDNILNRRFTAFNPREAFTTDITYLFYNGGKSLAYLSVIRDTCTHEVNSYVLSESLAEDFVLETVQLLIIKHKDEIKPGAILHSDQGIHYRCYDFSRLLNDKEIRQSMSRKANCWDNAAQESFFGHMKDEIKLKVLECKSFDELKAVIDDYIYYYNVYRGQWDLAKLSPVEYYKYRTTGVYPNAWTKAAIQNER